MRPLERVRVQRILEDTLRARGYTPGPERRVRIAGRNAVACDVSLVGAAHCVEYMNAADRAAYGSAIPAHSSPEALVVVAMAEGDAGGHVLVLDDRDFLYEPDPSRAGPGRPTVGEVEDRMRRVVIDYAAWLRANAR